MKLHVVEPHRGITESQRWPLNRLPASRPEVFGLSVASADPQDVIEDPEHVTEAVSQPPVVITEQEVAFSTAAVVPLPPTKPTRRVVAALRAKFLSSSGDAWSAPSHHPPRFIAEATMAREMRRL